MTSVLRRALALLAVLAVLAAVAWLLMPALRSPLEMVRLAWMPAPEALPVPVDGVERRQIADTWGGPRSGGRKHEGVDIFAPRLHYGIYAASRGAVNPWPLLIDQGGAPRPATINLPRRRVARTSPS